MPKIVERSPAQSPTGIASKKFKATEAKIEADKKRELGTIEKVHETPIPNEDYGSRRVSPGLAKTKSRISPTLTGSKRDWAAIRQMIVPIWMHGPPQEENKNYKQNKYKLNNTKQYPSSLIQFKIVPN